MILPGGVSSAQGQDRSNFQAVAPWNNCDFGYVKATEGTTFTDGTFAANWRNLKLAGIPRGSYHFFHPGLDPVAQAHFFVRTVMAQGLFPGDFLVADIEITSGGALGALRRALGLREPLKRHQNLPAVTKGLTAASVNAASKVFLDEASALAGPHNPVLVYTNLSVGSLLTSCTGYDLIIAWPSSVAPASVRPWRTWRMWQWGIVAGIDRDAYNGSKAELDAWIATFKPKPKPPPPPVVPSVSLGDDMPELPAGPWGTTAAPYARTLMPPAKVDLPEGAQVVPSVLRLSCASPASFQIALGNAEPAVWQTVTVDFQRSPELVNILEMPSGEPCPVLKIKPTDPAGNPAPVSYDWA